MDAWTAALCCLPVLSVRLQAYDVAKHGADWWAAHLFKHKTYVEARSMANPFVAFWRVYAFHAVLLTIMAALVRFRGTGYMLGFGFEAVVGCAVLLLAYMMVNVCMQVQPHHLACSCLSTLVADMCRCNCLPLCVCVSCLQSYVWHERDVAAGVPWIRLVAALLLGTVTDALMRVARAGAHLVLLSYRQPVQRKVCVEQGVQLAQNVACYQIVADCCQLLSVVRFVLQLAVVSKGTDCTPPALLAWSCHKTRYRRLESCGRRWTLSHQPPLLLQPARLS